MAARNEVSGCPDEKTLHLNGDSERQPLLPYSRDDGPACKMRSRESKTSRRFRTSIFWVFILCIGLTFWTWKWYLRPQMDDEREMIEGFTLKNADEEYEVAKKKHHFDGVRLQELDASLIPGGQSDPDGKRRLIFVGDIHGCAVELKALLQKVGFDEANDHLIAVGDVISKGPENAEVLDELTRINASSVRGNHEDRILALIPAVFESGELPPDADEPTSERFQKDTKLLRELTPQHLQYLRDMPLMLRIPPLPLALPPSQKTKSPIAEDILVVHAGLVPAVSLEKQDPYFVMNMRSIHKKTHAPNVEAESKKAKTKAWHDIWNWYNERLFKHKSLKDFSVLDELSISDSEGADEVDALSKAGKYPKPQVVVYGHRSKEGLQIERWTKGLDTGCVKGGKLTALVLDARGDEEIVQVRCEDHR